MSLSEWIEHYISSFVDQTGCLPGRVDVSQNLADRVEYQMVHWRGALVRINDWSDDPDLYTMFVSGDTPLRLSLLQVVDRREVDSWR